MGFMDALLGKRKVKGPAPDRLFAITTAYVTLDTEQGITSRGKAGIVFDIDGPEGGRVRELVDARVRRATGQEQDES